MNPTTAIGMIAGLALIIWAIIFSAEDATAFLNLPGLMIVIGGTIAATLISYPLSEVMRVFRVIGIVLRNERLYAEKDVQELVTSAQLLMRGEVNKVDQHISKLRNPFLRTGLQLVVDNTPAENIMELLQWRIERLRARERAEAQIFRTMSTFAPAFGMLGTLLGLINMLYSMDEAAFGQIGRNMSIALITTLYGLILANLLFKPVALKLERRTEQRVMLMNMVLEGVLLVQQQRSPGFIRETMHSFMEHYEDELHEDRKSRRRRRKR